MDVTLPGLLADIRNLSYMFYGFAIVWVILIGYLWSLSRQERDLRAQVDELKKSVDASSQKGS
jgi:CcmD family protein